MKIRVMFRDNDFAFYRQAKKEFDNESKVVKITGYYDSEMGRRITDYIPLINIKRLTEEEE